ncbi:hypothetical protein ACFFIO_14185 [Citricoccus parietis]|uniref:Type IV toxin-antitoxin system AbiEi family antitoxin domain-containing protein n=1 Tax=Citricoccus parietis TaxID=592307 RepID=A0ABV6F987_9MICC
MRSTTIESELLLRAEEHDGGRSSRALARMAQRGELVRVAPGTYVSTVQWFCLPGYDRQLLAVVALAQSRRRPVTFCGATALRLHGLPDIRSKPVLDVRAATRNQTGTRLQVSPFVNTKASLRIMTELQAQGRLASNGRNVPMLPPIRNHWLPGDEPGEDVELTVRLSDGSQVGRIRAVPLVSAMATVFGNEGLEVGTAAADALHRWAVDPLLNRGQVRAVRSQRGPDGRTSRNGGGGGSRTGGGRADSGRGDIRKISPERLSAELGLLRDDAAALQELVEASRARVKTKAAGIRFDRQWTFADGRAESPGESLTRAVIHCLGFEVPDLQYPVHDQHGEFLGRVDFWWPSIRLVGEFDGHIKYGGTLGAAEDSGSAGRNAVTEEKRREDAIRREVDGFARWMWSDVRNTKLFAQLLEEFRVPRRP